MPVQPPQVVKATLKALPNGAPLAVHFNPQSLVYSVENTVSQQSSGPSKTQYVAQFSGKLTMDLQFDTTGTGVDVRVFTNQVALFMQASGNASAAVQNASAPNANGGAQSAPAKAPPVLSFEWGSYEFRGVMDSFKETIDFFSADGVALRALVGIGLSRQDHVFDDTAQFSGSNGQASQVPTSTSDSLQSLSTRGGDPNAARALGAGNGLESLRFTGGSPIQVGAAGAQLNPPAAFVSATASASAGIGLGISASITAGAGASLSTQSSAQLNGLAPAFGGSASAGISATAGAFAGLQSGRATASTTAHLDPLQMLPTTVGTSVSTGSGAAFSLGGAALSAGSAGLSTNVGTPASLSARLTFNSDD